MLILTRQNEQSIHIGDDVVVKILDSKGTVKIGISAPKEIAVHREEIYNKIAQQNHDKG